MQTNRCCQASHLLQSITGIYRFCICGRTGIVAAEDGGNLNWASVPPQEFRRARANFRPARSIEKSGPIGGSGQFKQSPPPLDLDFHTHHVTSTLAPRNKSAHHRRGEGSTGKTADNGLNSCVVKILTSKPPAINIFQTLFANPAPSKPFQGMGGGGLSSELMV